MAVKHCEITHLSRNGEHSSSVTIAVSTHPKFCGLSMSQPTLGIETNNENLRPRNQKLCDLQYLLLIAELSITWLGSS